MLVVAVVEEEDCLFGSNLLFLVLWEMSILAEEQVEVEKVLKEIQWFWLDSDVLGSPREHCN